jgi:hypothetical protein
MYEPMEGFEVRERRLPSQGYGPMHSKDRANFREFYETGLATGGQSGGILEAIATQRFSSRVAPVW